MAPSAHLAHLAHLAPLALPASRHQKALPLARILHPTPRHSRLVALARHPLIILRPPLRHPKKELQGLKDLLSLQIQKALQQPKLPRQIPLKILIATHPIKLRLAILPIQLQRSPLQALAHRFSLPLAASPPFPAPATVSTARLKNNPLMLALKY